MNDRYINTDKAGYVMKHLLPEKEEDYETIDLESAYCGSDSREVSSKALSGLEEKAREAGCVMVGECASSRLVMEAAKDQLERPVYKYDVRWSGKGIRRKTA